MSSNNTRFPLRNRLGFQRPKLADENATSKHARQPSGGKLAVGGSRLPSAVGKNGVQRPVLNEVTTAALNAKEVGGKPSLKGKESGVVINAKRFSATITAQSQRAPLLPAKAQTAVPLASSVNARAAPVSGKALRPVSAIFVAPDPQPEPLRDASPPRADNSEEEEMDVEGEQQLPSSEKQVDESLLAGEEEVKSMMGLADSDEEELEETEKVAPPKSARVWPEVSTERGKRYQQEIESIRATFEDEVDIYDTTMVSEYSDDIFQYMADLEEDMMPGADYISGQSEITWDMRQLLVDWLLQVHRRYHMLPETLWIAINIVDRFLTKRVVSRVKLQLVGVTAMFIASKYEEILAPSVDEFVFMTENGYSKEEILKGERIVLQTLEFKISQYCSPYSWMRRISKADDYDIQTRTLSKFLTEVTLLDYRFLRVKPSLVAAVGMYTARKMLDGDWSEPFVFYSGYTEEHLLPGHRLLISKLVEDGFDQQHVVKKYADKKFLKASTYAIHWATLHADEIADGMELAQ